MFLTGSVRAVDLGYTGCVRRSKALGKIPMVHGGSDCASSLADKSPILADWMVKASGSGNRVIALIPNQRQRAGGADFPGSS